MNNPRFAFDTNILVSALLLRSSVPAQALYRAEREGVVTYSYATLAELSRVLLRPKFARFIAPEDIDELLARIHRTWEMVNITHQIQVCRDPKDDMFLELAVNGQASTLITGDRDLLTLNPYRGIEILTPSEFLKKN